MRTRDRGGCVTIVSCSGGRNLRMGSDSIQFGWRRMNEDDLEM